GANRSSTRSCASRSRTGRARSTRGTWSWWCTTPSNLPDTRSTASTPGRRIDFACWSGYDACRPRPGDAGGNRKPAGGPPQPRALVRVLTDGPRGAGSLPGPGPLACVDDLHHLHLLAARQHLVHLQGLLVVPLDAEHVPRLALLLLHRVVLLPLERDD